MPKTTIAFTIEKECKHSRRYKEVVKNGEDPVIGSLYVSRKHCEGQDALKVTVEFPG